MGESKTTRFWVGASTLGALGTAARGIRSLDIAADGGATLGEPVDVGPNPMFLAVSPATGVLGIVHELADGRVSTWTFEGDRLSPFSLPGATGAADPCHLAFDEAGGLFFAANYSGARLSVHHAAPDAPADVALSADFTGTGPNHERQESSHPHQAVVDSARDRLLVPDLGADRVRVLALDTLPDALVHDEARDIVVHAGAGPRHLVIAGDLAITANELDRTASVIDLVEGREVAWCSIGDDVEPRGLGCSAIRLTRGGIVLVGDRDADALRALRFDRATRTLELVATVVTGGRHPRDLELTHDERFALVADQGSDSIAVVALDGVGVPTGVVGVVETPAPACLARV
ncbi:lactonase family protein [Agromyces cerinus]|uniref:6-phosphogluconolactonase n=1 Tax=Agromyces cerinus subsp. cerinus TaxID=232089 RepID=A0A1N6I169_9MICO|nr:beta-propeller fold lactonase family protein [Agromyces cerinus]SIO25786.1 6-phosphogluconolactonase [Agromyces cerinus subsp. cerinus]